MVRNLEILMSKQERERETETEMRKEKDKTKFVQLPITLMTKIKYKCIRYYFAIYLQPNLSHLELMAICPKLHETNGSVDDANKLDCYFAMKKKKKYAFTKHDFKYD